MDLACDSYDAHAGHHHLQPKSDSFRVSVSLCSSCSGLRRQSHTNRRALLGTGDCGDQPGRQPHFGCACTFTMLPKCRLSQNSHVQDALWVSQCCCSYLHLQLSLHLSGMHDMIILQLDTSTQMAPLRQTSDTSHSCPITCMKSCLV